MSKPQSAKVELDSLIAIFFDQSDELGQFTETAAERIQEPQRSLLNHDFHMTVTLEKYHSTAVDVQVLRNCKTDNVYSRKITLSRKSDQHIVQFGIVRLHFDYLDDEVCHEIEQEQTPLGRILIQHDVMRRVELLSLYEIQAGPVLSRELGIEPGQVCWGRTALIYCDDEPAIELLEIVADN